MATPTSNVTSGRVTIVDPNSGLAVSSFTPNGTPPEELLRPYVALSVFRRKGAALSVDSQGRYDLREDAETLQINMLDFDPATGYSESYLDDVVGRGSRNSIGGFGIKSLSIKLNANYVPEVSITFLDLHAGSLFRAGSEGPLSVIYDYPPPLYKLTVKGAYGKYVEYVLHQVKETNNFGGGAANGTPEITVQFVGQYFGPMTDVLVGYLQAVPYLKGTGIVGADALGRRNSGPPTSFYDLVQRGKLLYTSLDAYKDQSVALQATKAYAKLEADLAGLRAVMVEKLDAARLESALNAELIKGKGGALGGVLRVNPVDEVRPPNQLVIRFPAGAIQEYDAKNGVGAGEKLIQGILITILFGPLQAAGNLASDTTLAKRLDFTTNPQNNSNYRVKIHRSETGPYVIVYDFQPLYTLLNQLSSQVAQQGGAASARVQDDVAVKSNQLLGLRPTVGSIIELVCNDYDYLLEQIRKAGTDLKREPDRREADGGRVVGLRTGSLPWPTVYEARTFVTDPTKGQETLRYPGIYPAFADWPEVRLVEAYSRACLEAAQDAQRTEAVQAAIDPHYYVPITSLERVGPGASNLVVNPYLEVKSVYDLIYLLVVRYAFSADYTYANVFHVAPGCINRSSVSRAVGTFLSGGLTTGTSYFASPVDPNDGATYGLLSSNVSGVGLPNKAARRDLIERLARLDAGNAARGIKGKDALVQALLSLAKTTPADLVAHLHLVSDPNPVGAGNNVVLVPNLSPGDAPDGDSGRQGVGLARQLNSAYNGLVLDQSITVGYRGNPDDTSFQGLADIVTQDSSQGKALVMVKAEAKPGDNAMADPVSAETAAFLVGISDNIFALKNKPIISSANLLLYPDLKAAASKGAAGEALSDLFNDANTGGNFYASLMTVLDELTANSLLTNEDEENLANIINLLARHVQYIYKSATTTNDAVFGRFFYPGAIEVPTWYVAYLDFIALGTDYNVTNFTVNKYAPRQALLGDLDKALVRKAKVDYLATGGVAGLIAAYRSVKALDIALPEQRAKLANNAFWQAFIAPVYLLNTSTLTFIKPADNVGLGDGSKAPAVHPGFVSLTTASNKLRSPFVVYATAFWTELTQLLKVSAQESAKAASSSATPLGDADFKTQIYYSFKSLYDRCLAGLTRPPAPLFDSFKFITRSYQDISNECIVDFRNFFDDAVDPEVSVYSTISRLLQKNGFLFFPLHSFVDFGSAGDDPSVPYWGGNFGLVDRLNDRTTARAAFVCMLVGSYSSQLNNVNNLDYPNDGFDFGDKQPPDFNTGQAAGPVVAFRVRVGLQNQSVFSEPRIDSAEFKNTDVSFKLQDEIINKQATATYRVRKSQSLLNVYAQRSYTCSIGVPLGNMCLQPTQYFQLEGLNLYGGAYLIQEVTHEYSADTQRLQTNFKGVRVGRHVFGVVSDPLLDYVGGSSTQAFGAASGVYQALDVSLVGNDARLLSDARLRQICLDPVYGFSYPYAMAKAVIETESAGYPAFSKDTNKCIIRFEPTHFLAATKNLPGGPRLVGATYLRDASGQILRTAGGLPRLNESQVHKDQLTEYAALAQAEAIDKQAAWASTSWGRMQILGSNHADAGYPGTNGVINMVEAFQKTEENQIVGAFNFIKTHPLARQGMVQTPRPGFAKFAAAYNGAYYAQGNYDAILEKNYNLYNTQRDPNPGQILLMHRTTKLSDRITGVLTNQGSHVCYILEDTVRPNGVFVPGETAIQPGLYQAIVSKSPGLKRDTVELLKVPGHGPGLIRLHSGGTPADTLGCLLTGFDLDEKTHTLQRQQDAENKVTTLVSSMLREGNVYISVR
jgi:hypothetical protein